MSQSTPERDALLQLCDAIRSYMPKVESDHAQTWTTESAVVAQAYRHARQVLDGDDNATT